MATAHETDVSTMCVELHMQQRVSARHRGDLIEHLTGQEWIVDGTEEQRGTPDSAEEPNGARPPVIVSGIRKAMNGGGDGIVERENRSCALQGTRVEQVGVRGQLGVRLPAQGLEEVATIDARESTFDPS
jgi:hypothetical protein